MSVLAILAAVALSGGGAARSHEPVAHASAVCADFSDQAAAQRAHDTRDGDGDGVFCEDLPCPCVRPRAGGGTTAPAQHPLVFGRSVPLHRVSRTGGCRVRGPLPDPRCTPGARFRRATPARVCRPGYASAARDVSRSTKDSIYAAYGIRRHFDGADGEVDHLVPLELGGSNARANLFPEAAPGSHHKNRLENALHAEVCSGRLRLRVAQRLIARNWLAAYRARF